MEKQLHNIDHSYLRYANCWEDADVLLAALSPQPGARILSIGSAGDNSFSLLTSNPEKVVAVDVNPVQLHLIELKKAAFEVLEHAEFIRFLGFVPANDRLQWLSKVSAAMPELSARYWRQKTGLIDAGIIHGGKFERYFRIFHSRLLPWIHGKERVEELLTLKSSEAQERFYVEKWNSRRWKVFFKLFFSRAVMGKFGRDPAFFKEVKVPVATAIYETAARHLRKAECADNYFLRYIMRGTFGDQLPHYARRENFDAIRNNISRISTWQGLAEVCADIDDFSHFNLSNIFEYMSTPVFKEVATKLANGSRAGATFAYWNLMVSRGLADVLPDRFRSDTQRSEELHRVDKGFFYRQLHIDKRI
ncbi:MAG: DUF3419 family protein [Flavobacteriales bacterium]|nr:DUF3419 family protein [Flavobacteriales bacterium]MCB9449003.1 DUF3419 family protein [Flavobacteriales bacterium]